MHRQAPTVLVVDDAGDARLRFTRWLSAEGYRCQSASGRGSALRLARRLATHVAVVSSRLDGDSLQLVRDLSGHTDGAAVVLVTDEASVDGIRLARAAGAVDCLVSPGQHELVAAVTRAARHIDTSIERRQARLEAAASLDARHRALCQLLDGVGTAAAAAAALRATFGGRVPALFAHARRVARVAAALASDLRLPADVVARIEDAALLHDIGKLSLPEAVLLGDAAPDDEVLDALLDHHARGLEMLAVAPALAPVADIIESVHECWDGSGYPRGLVGSEIPLAARVVAVADVLDAVQTWAVHQEPTTRHGAHAALVREAGTRLDPDLVRVCLHAGERQPCCC